MLEKPLGEKEGIMSNGVKTQMDDDLRPEYDLTKLDGLVRGKYAERYCEGTNLILLEPDVAEAFSDSASVNEALRLLMKIAENTSKKEVQA